MFFLKIGPTPASFLFLSFQTHITNFTKNRYVKKCSSSIWWRDLNSRPLEHEFPPITTRPGLLPDDYCYCHFSFTQDLTKTDRQMPQNSGR